MSFGMNLHPSCTRRPASLPVCEIDHQDRHLDAYGSVPGHPPYSGPNRPFRVPKASLSRQAKQSCTEADQLATGRVKSRLFVDPVPIRGSFLSPIVWCFQACWTRAAARHSR